MRLSFCNRPFARERCALLAWVQSPELNFDEEPETPLCVAVTDPNSVSAIISSCQLKSGSATCWDAIGHLGRSVYTSNPNNSTLSDFNIERNGGLTPIDNGVVGHTPSGSPNIDIAASADGRCLYTLDTAAGAISVFAFQ